MQACLGKAKLVRGWLHRALAALVYELKTPLDANKATCHRISHPLDEGASPTCRISW
jgi:hypothetical protein